MPSFVLITSLNLYFSREGKLLQVKQQETEQNSFVGFVSFFCNHQTMGHLEMITFDIFHNLTGPCFSLHPTHGIKRWRHLICKYSITRKVSEVGSLSL